MLLVAFGKHASSANLIPANVELHAVGFYLRIIARRCAREL
ncbi:hypothetical protein ACXZ65_17165 [Streptomyces aculeolatus]